jgi:hypothetical protein
LQFSLSKACKTSLSRWCGSSQKALVVKTNPFGTEKPACVISPREAPFHQQVAISLLEICENRLIMLFCKLVCKNSSPERNLPQIPPKRNKKILIR